MSNNELQLVATSNMGLEFVVARELKQLGYQPGNSANETGRTYFTGDFYDLVRANINLRTAGKILIQLARFEVGSDFDDIFDAVQAVDWEYWMPSNASILVDARSVRSTITSVPAIQRTVKKAIVKRLMKAYHTTLLPENGPEYTVELSLLKDVASLTINSTGRGLHRRGYRQMNVPVPLRETLASALVQLSVWTQDRPLVDPFCASGTIPIEAAMLARNIAPGMNRVFAAQSWPVIDANIWEDIRAEAKAAILPPLKTKIYGYDIDGEALQYARFHARQAGVDNDIIFKEQDFKDLTDERLYGCIICNPPYGERVGEQVQFQSLYTSMPGVLARLPSWSFFIYTSWNDFESLIGQRATRRRKLYNSRIECTYFQFLGPKPPKPTAVNAVDGVDGETKVDTIIENQSADMIEGVKESEETKIISPVKTPIVITPVFQGLDEYSLYQIEEFGKCLKNRSHHLRRYPKRGITCYRLYDRDFPEVPLAIDIFEEKYLHIAEYERPDERSIAMHQQWLDKIVEKSGEVLGIDSDNIFLKRRSRQRGLSQYEKLSESSRIITVHEGGLLFRCNMTDYLDVGLFLDHRLTRDMVRKVARGKRVLNLFSYTGAFSCYAADGGAALTVSVDLSPTYLDWARTNMEINGFYEQDNPWHADHRYIKADAINFLRTIPVRGKISSGQTFGLDHSDFDLCICDPPTFSNSKSTEDDWDVQQSHVELLRLLASRMNPGGTVYFSNNYKRFKMNESELTDLYQIREISTRTVPEEYHNKRIHRCWQMTLKDGF